MSCFTGQALGGRQSHKLLLLRQQLQQQHCRPVLRRQQATTVCRHDLRKSANNVEERRSRQQNTRGTSAAERMLTPEQLEQAKATLGACGTLCCLQHFLSLQYSCTCFNKLVLQPIAA
jgi:hypothetical protein